MSKLDNKGLKDILFYGEDILSSKGTIQESWNTFKGNTSYDNPILESIINSIDNSIMENLYLGNDNCLSTIGKIHNINKSIKSKNLMETKLTTLFEVLDTTLSGYFSINDKYWDNNKINVDDKLLDSYYSDESVILCSMLENGLIDPNKVQGLLDNQNLELKATATRLVNSCSQRESLDSNNEDITSGARKPLLLKAEDFGTDVSTILNCVNSFINDDMELFPNSISEINRIIFPREKFDSQVLYSQDNYISNLANYDIISSTAKCIENSFDLDSETAIYVLSSLMKQLESFVDKYDKNVCLIMYMATILVLINRINEFGINEINTISLKYSIKQELANAFLIYNNNKQDGLDNQVSKMIKIPQELKNFVEKYYFDNSDIIKCNDGSDILSNLDEAIEDIISSIDEVDETMEYYGIQSSDNKGIEVVSLESAGVSSREVEHGSKVRELKDSYLSKIEGLATVIHNDLNDSLLEGNFDNAAIEIAREVALLEQTNDNQIVESVILGTVKRDISTYSKMIESSSVGISNHLVSARSDIERLLNQ